MIGLALDIGTATSKIGFIGESSPRLITESVYMTSDTQRSAPHEEYDMFYKHREERLFGNNVNIWRNDINAYQLFYEAWQDEQRELKMQSCTIIKENYLKFLQDLVREMKELKEKHNTINQQNTDYGLLINEPAYLKKHQVIKMREVLSSFAFEQLRLSAIYFIKDSVSIAYSQGKSNAIVVDSGHNFTSISRIIDGYCEKTINFNFGGNIISYEIENYLNKKGLLDRTNFCHQKRGRCENYEQLCKYKQLTSFKSLFTVDNSSQVEEGDVNLQFPDKATVTIGRDEIIQPFTQYQDYKKVTDIYFPENYYGIARSIIELLEEDNYNNYIDTIIFAGGNMLFSNLADRIADQVGRMLTSRKFAAKNIVKCTRPMQSSWIGSSIAGSTETFRNFWCTLPEYREYGLSIINKKCPL